MVLLGKPGGRGPLGRGRKILKWIFKKWPLVNVVMNFGVPHNAGNLTT